MADEDEVHVLVDSGEVEPQAKPLEMMANANIAVEKLTWAMA